MKEKTDISRFRVAVVMSLALLFLSPNAFPAVRWQAAPAKKEDTADDHIKKGREAFDAKNFSVAKQEAQRAMKLKKDSPEANLLLALVYRNQGKPTDSLKYAKKAINYRQDYADAHLLVAFLFFDKDELKASSTELDLAMSQGLRFSNAYVLKGTLELLAGRNKNALESYQEAVKLAAPTDRFLPNIRERAAALENYIEFGARSDNALYKQPVLLNSPMPRYTETARRNGVRGRIRAAVLINEHGGVSAVILLSHLPDGLDDQAIAAAQQLNFRPATKAGNPVSFWKSVVIEFNFLF